MSWWWMKWLLIGGIAVWLGYCRHRISQIVRTRAADTSRLASSRENNTDEYLLLTQSYQTNNSYLEFEFHIHAHGLCGDMRQPPLQRICTPIPHVHLDQIEYFTVRKGRLGYRLGDKTESCDIHTCPSPIVIPPLVPHTLWMDDNKENLVVSIRIEPIYKKKGIRQEFFENYIGAIRDQHLTLWQTLVLFDNAETYIAFLPLPLSKIISKMGALIGQLFGYQIEYDEYTTRS